MRLMTFLLSLLMAFPALAAEIRMSDGRGYVIHLPKGATNPPLIIALHGGGGSPAQFDRDAGLTGPALRAGYAIAYPEGTGRLRSWNGGYCCGAAARDGVDDMAFLDRVIADATRRFGTARVFLTGMSNGAIMAQAYAAARPGTVTAIATVAGTMDTDRTRPKGPVPILHIHGSKDRHVPYTGGTGPDSLTRTEFSPVADVMAAFIRVAGPGLIRSDRVIDPASDGMRVLRRDLSRGGMPVVSLLTVEGGGHDWPGGRRAKRRGATRDIVAADEILKFFGSHR